MSTSIKANSQIIQNINESVLEYADKAVFWKKKEDEKG